MVVNVDTTVAVIVENHNGTNMRFVVLGMNNGSHLCSCRTLQILGLCCEHFWMALHLSLRFNFHVGILNQHRRAEQGRQPTGDWPEQAKPKWAVALNHNREWEAETPAVLSRDQAGLWQAIGEDVTIEYFLVQLNEMGASRQDRRLLYVDCLKDLTTAVGQGVQTVNLNILRRLGIQICDAGTTRVEGPVGGRGDGGKLGCCSVGVK